MKSQLLWTLATTKYEIDIKDGADVGTKAGNQLNGSDDEDATKDIRRGCRKLIGVMCIVTVMPLLLMRCGR